jgi:hypothetical protein
VAASISRSLAASPDLPAPLSKARLRWILQLLLPRVDLARVNPVAPGELVHRRLLAQRLQGEFAFSAASIFRRVLFVIVCSVYPRSSRFFSLSVGAVNSQKS